MEDKEHRRAGDPRGVADFIKAWWFLILFGLGVSGSLIAAWFDLSYLRSIVNPESRLEWREKAAKRACDTRLHRTVANIRWCVMSRAGKNPLECLNIK